MDLPGAETAFTAGEIEPAYGFTTAAVPQQSVRMEACPYVT